jgi:hypothetical protein
MLVMWAVPIRYYYLGWGQLKVLLTELSIGGRKECRHGELHGSDFMTLRIGARESWAYGIN